MAEAEGIPLVEALGQVVVQAVCDARTNATPHDPEVQAHWGRKLHRALSEKGVVEDGGIWEDRALAAEAALREIAAARIPEVNPYSGRLDAWTMQLIAREALASYRTQIGESDDVRTHD